MSKLKGFTLLELIIGMAIVAVLMGLSILGIQTVQRSSRDTARRAAVNAIQLEIEAIRADTGSYPTSISMVTATRVVTFNPSSRTLTLTDAAQTPRTATGQDGTQYCYAVSSGVYQFGAALEAGGNFRVGSHTTCTNITPT